MPTLTAEQRKLLTQPSDEPLRLMDPDTNQEYVLVEAEVYDQLRSSMNDINPRDLYPALHKALAAEGWDDAKMDDYNRYG